MPGAWYVLLAVCPLPGMCVPLGKPSLVLATWLCWVIIVLYPRKVVGSIPSQAPYPGFGEQPVAVSLLHQSFPRLVLENQLKHKLG